MGYTIFLNYQSLKNFESSLETQRPANKILENLQIDIHINLDLDNDDDYDRVQKTVKTVSNFIMGNGNLKMKRLTIFGRENNILDVVSEVIIC